jgi:UDP-N-acetylglucosamine 1-carboxyvinyltransferase
MNLNAGNLTIQGDLVNNGTITPGTGTVTFNGTSTQTISGTGALANFNNLVINKASGTLTLSQPVRVAGTLTMTQGDITIHGARADHMEVMLDKLSSAGAIITSTADGVRVKMEHRPRAIDVSTLPYPGFATDLLPFIIGMNAIADGHAIVTENVFESRFMFVNELVRLGAQITVDGHHASIDGIPQLSGAPVEASDIRAGAGLVLVALVADGETTVDGAFHVDRGYPLFAEQLRALGGNVTRE